MFREISFAAAALAAISIPAQAQNCTREGLKTVIGNYFKAVETHNMSALETAPNLRITENGSEIKPGEGFFKTGGKVQFQRSLIDTERCGTLTQAVIDETPDPNAPARGGRGAGGGGGGARGAAPGGAAPGGGRGPGAAAPGGRGGGNNFQGPQGGAGGRGAAPGGAGPGGRGGPGAAPGGGAAGGRGAAPGGAGAPRGGLPASPPYNGTAVILAVRLKVEKGKVSEIETIVNRRGELFFNPDGVLETKSQDWESILPPAQRSTREYMNTAADKYFSGFNPNVTDEAPFASPCDRWEGGVSTTAATHNCSAKSFNMTHTHRRYPVTDVEAGIAAGFVNFNGGLPDVHIFKIKNGKIDWIQAVFGGSAQGEIWPDEKK
jgi:hypothetical protein